MDKNFLWLSASLFCCRSCWSNLLSQGIKPFLTLADNEKWLYSFILELDYLGGENIRLALLVEDELAEEVAKRTDSFFKNFFLHAQLPEKEVQLPADTVFMSFPSNTIQYGLYSLAGTDTSAFISLNNFRKELSKLMIEVFQEESTDEETMITLAFYLHLSLIKIIIQNHPVKNAYKLVEALLQNFNTFLPREEVLIDDEFVRNKFNNNKVILNEIYRDVMDYQEAAAHISPVWLGDWIKLCNQEVKEALNLQKGQETDLTRIHNQMAFLINQQLGITESMGLLLFTFINQILLGSAMDEVIY